RTCRGGAGGGGGLPAVGQRVRVKLYRDCWGLAPSWGSAPYPALVAEIRIGPCSWADEALSKHWYPKGLPAGERLGYYAQSFDTVEGDSTYYRLPGEEMVQRWAERTPDGFVMHVKAVGLMTRPPVKLEGLPPRPRRPRPT